MNTILVLNVQPDKNKKCDNKNQYIVVGDIQNTPPVVLLLKPPQENKV